MPGVEPGDDDFSINELPLADAEIAAGMDEMHDPAPHRSCQP